MRVGEQRQRRGHEHVALGAPSVLVFETDETLGEGPRAVGLGRSTLTWPGIAVHYETLFDQNYGTTNATCVECEAASRFASGMGDAWQDVTKYPAV